MACRVSTFFVFLRRYYDAMSKRLCFIVFVLSIVLGVTAQNDTVVFSASDGPYDEFPSVVFTESNLPIVVIETDGGVDIPDEPKVLGTMKIIWHQDGSRNYLTDIDTPEFLNYNGRIGIETRGYTSQDLPKKPYGLTTLKADNVTNNNVSILGMPEENDWVLNSLAFDQTGMRDVLAYELSERIGQYASRRVYCEVMVNGDYKGLYVFMEKIKVDKSRVNIEKMDASCNNYPEVTGGYIMQADRPKPGEPYAWAMVGNNYWPSTYYTYYSHQYPKPEVITDAQHNYIKSVFFDFDAQAANHNESIIDGYPSIIDIPSFIDFMMIAEYTSNVDVYTLSTYFHKDRNGKLRAGPVWDYNLSFGYDEFGDRSRYDVWQFYNGSNDGSRFWTNLFFDCPTFRCYFAKRWNELTAPGQPLNYMVVEERINQLDTLLTEAIYRDNHRWWKMLQHDEYVADMKEWIQLRIGWLNDTVGSCADCSDMEVPPLVISKINYHPMDWWAIDGDRLEFIEITNNGDAEVDLTGVYFRELGITYKFPNNAHVAGHEAILLCSDSLVFVDYYGIVPFGQYMRKLSNKSENLVLADAWGNVIDQVHYSDSEPWPTQADGEGPYLQLKDLDSDNSLAENWTTCDDLTFVADLMEKPVLIPYPNPTTGKVHVELSANPSSFVITDLTGKVIMEMSVSNPQFDLDLSTMPAGLYLLKAQMTDGMSAYCKIVKL